MNNDPLIAHETQPTKTVAELVRSDERLKEDCCMTGMFMISSTTSVRRR
jgi:hypothetical protein